MEHTRFSIPVIVLLLICWSTLLHAQWVQTNGPGTGPVNSLVASGTNVIAGEYMGNVYRSTDNGTHWSLANTGLPGTAEFVYSLAVVGTDFIAGTYDSGAYRSTDNGVSWTAASTGLAGGGLYINCFAVGGENLFAGTFNGVYRSTNNGTSWMPANTGMTTAEAKTVNALAVINSNLFAGTQGAGVLRSIDNGTSWTSVNTGLDSVPFGSGPNPFYVQALAVMGTNLFVGTTGGVFVSTDSGAHWNGGREGLDIYSLAVIGRNLFIGTDQGVYRTSDNGRSWVSENTGLANNGGTVGSLAVNDTLLFAGINDRVWKRSLSEITASVRQTASDLPTEVRLEQNYPNPVNGSTTIGFSIPASGWVSLRVYDIDGREVATLVNENLSQGGYSVSWNSTEISNGSYRYVLESDGVVQTRSLIVMK